MHEQAKAAALQDSTSCFPFGIFRVPPDLSSRIPSVFDSFSRARVDSVSA